MGTNISIPATRVSDAFARQRLLNQLNADQRNLVLLQTQISTGRRLTLPSDDAQAALRAMSLQQLLERKEQVGVNLTTNQSFLAATDAALTSVSGLLSEVRGTALSVVDSAASNAQRAAAAQEVNRAIQQLVDTGNQKFRGRFLFAGSRTSVQPFESTGSFVQYNGNEGQLSSYSDIDLLFRTNADGNAVFGAISQQVQGTADLNPVLRASTRLADLRGGQGISEGSIAVSDGFNTSIVDISNAETLGDVVGLLEANPPQGRTLRATVTPTGLDIELDATGGGNLTIREVGGGTTVRELGILAEVGFGTGPIVGTDLNPRVSRTTLLSDILGSSASATVVSGGINNDLVIQAVGHGSDLNDVTISFVNNPLVNAGSETVVYDDSNPLDKKLIFQIDAGNTTADDIVAALNNDPVAGLLFQAQLSASDSETSGSAGSGAIDVTATAVTAGGSGVDFDKSAGFRIVNGGQTYTVSVATSQTIEDLLNQINGSGAGVVAEINEQGTGLNLRSRVSGSDFSVGENGGQSASQLGLRTFNESTRLENLNHGLGVHAIDGTDFSIRRKDGTLLAIDVSSAETIGDVLELINTHPDNLNPATAVVARLATHGNGIELVTTDTSSASTFAVLKVNGSQAAEDLGLIPQGEQTSAAATASAGVETIAGRDTNPAEVQGTFTALIRLHQALINNDTIGISRAVDLLDQSQLELNLSRAELGARQQGLDVLQSRLDSEVISLKDSLSKEIDTDLPQAISDLTARQAAMEATLRLTASISRLTLLDFL